MINRHHSSWLLGYFGCYFFKSCCCWTWRGSVTLVFSLNSFYLFWNTSGHKVSINELTSWIRCIRWGRQCGLLQDSFENHFRDMFLNVTHIKYMTCTYSFKAALMAFLVTSWLNWLRHCMHIVYFALWYEMIQATACAGTFVRAVEHALRAKDHFRARLTRVWRRGEVEHASETSPVWSAHKDVLRLNKCSSCEENSDRNSSCEWGGQP